MSLKELGLMLKVGGVLNCSPSTIEPQPVTLKRKIYLVSLVILISGGLVSQLYHRSFYSFNKNVIKRIISISRDIVFATHGVCTIINSVLLRKQWHLLIANIKVTELVLNNPANEKFYYKYPVLILVVFYSTFTYLYVTFFVVWKYQLFLRLNTEAFSNHTLLCNRYMIFLIGKMLIMRYKSLRKLINDRLIFYTERHNSRLNSRKDLIVFMKNVEFFMNVLKETVDTMNEIFGWPILLDITYSMLVFLGTLVYNILDSSALVQSNEAMNFTVALLTYAVLSVFIGLLAVLLRCDTIQKEAAQVAVISRKLRLFFVDGTAEEKKQFNLILRSIDHHLPIISAARFYTVDRETISSISGNLINFVIVMIQFYHSSVV